MSEADVKGGENARVFEVGLREEVRDDGEVGVQLEELEEQTEEGGGRVGGGGDVGETGGERDEVGQGEPEAGLVPVAREVYRVAGGRVQ